MWLTSFLRFSTTFPADNSSGALDTWIFRSLDEALRRFATGAYSALNRQQSVAHMNYFRDASDIYRRNGRYSLEEAGALVPLLQSFGFSLPATAAPAPSGGGQPPAPAGGVDPARASMLDRTGSLRPAEAGAQPGAQPGAQAGADASGRASAGTPSGAGAAGAHPAGGPAAMLGLARSFSQFLRGEQEPDPAARWVVRRALADAAGRPAPGKSKAVADAGHSLATAPRVLPTQAATEALTADLRQFEEQDGGEVSFVQDLPAFAEAVPATPLGSLAVVVRLQQPAGRPVPALLRYALPALWAAVSATAYPGGTTHAHAVVQPVSAAKLAAAGVGEPGGEAGGDAQRGETKGAANPIAELQLAVRADVQATLDAKLRYLQLEQAADRGRVPPTLGHIGAVFLHICRGIRQKVLELCDAQGRQPDRATIEAVVAAEKQRRLAQLAQLELVLHRRDAAAPAATTAGDDHAGRVSRAGSLSYGGPGTAAGAMHAPYARADSAVPARGGPAQGPWR